MGRTVDRFERISDRRTGPTNHDQIERTDRTRATSEVDQDVWSSRPAVGVDARQQIVVGGEIGEHERVTRASDHRTCACCVGWHHLDTTISRREPPSCGLREDAEQRMVRRSCHGHQQ